MKPGVIPYQSGDFDVSNGVERPSLPQFHSTHDGFNKPHDIPLNKRNFMYVPCAPIAEFRELGYCNSEYPFEKPGFNLMDRSDGISLLENHNDIIAVKKSTGWRTARCDVSIKEGTTYWEVELLKGGAVPDMGDTDDIRRSKELVDSRSHIRFGISRREASLEAPVGFDSYSYGIRDHSLESIHKGKLIHVLEQGTPLKPGDILGFVLKLPDTKTQIEQAKEYTERRIAALNQSDLEANNNGHSSNHSVDPWNHDTSGPQKKKTRFNRAPSNKEFQKALLESIDYNNIVRDQIAIRYKNQLFFEGTDYVKTTKPEYYSSDKRERQEYYTLKDSSLAVYLNGKYLGKAFENINPFLPPFSELQYNEKFYFNYWKNGEYSDDTDFSNKDLNKSGSDINFLKSTTEGSHSTKGALLRNKYVNNNKLGYYPTVSCFNGGEAKIVTTRGDLRYLDEVIKEYGDLSIKTLDILSKEAIAEDVVWDMIDEIEEECEKK
ncbi:hypothetical protein KAFR_0J00680 [Kazachstania africana CBS 2517]|uniref:SPRY domain-containing protein n=1 Tax=Kazachstania africana (strain ATCC 22294 / BCRC 22015 / CBS 2517 / CECT 1963 / NBRC 1671 / NRRL Y-8276) TaxID=1071382 RepID=H2B0I6_KAZAF|nr:hypothetical protein KAFR_0J00680 [Kazachstania africana CBS 2517]CCF60136.1 hypothetical protein KAFR_0J00680 [Kazachstania africana CBS 2517]